MAQKNSTQSQAAVDASLPEGFVLSGSRNGVGWFNQGKLGNKCQGKLIGMFTRPDPLKNDKEKGILGQSDFFQVELTEPCEVRSETGTAAHMIEAQAGDVVNVNYGPKTKPWKALVDKMDQGAEYEVVAVVIGDKVSISGGAKKMHNILAGSKCITPAMSTGAEAAPASEDEVGF